MTQQGITESALEALSPPPFARSRAAQPPRPARQNLIVAQQPSFSKPW